MSNYYLCVAWNFVDFAKKFNIIHQFAFCILFRAHNAKVRRLDLYYLHIIQNGKDIERNLIND